MNNEHQNGREILKKALAELDREYVENFSEIGAELLAQKLRFKLRKRRRLSKRIAGIAAALLIVCSSVTAFAKGEEIVSWVLDFYETNVKIHFQDDDVQKAPATIETIYMPTYIPEGYELDPSYKSTDYNSRFRWKTENGDFIQLLQSTLNGEREFDIENVEYSEIYHNELLIICTKKHDMAIYRWHTDEYYFNLTVYPHESDEENFKIIDSIQKYENTNNKEF